jgi:hypothetical protein
MNADLNRHARRQHGLVTLAQAREAGLSPDAVEHRASSGAWRRVVAGVYAVGSSPATWRQRVLAACLATGEGAVASHRTAAALWGLSGSPPGPVHVTVRRHRTHRSRITTVHETLILPPGDVTTVDRIPVTRPARTLIDVAGCVPRPILEEAVDDALCRRLVTLDRLVRRHEELRAGRKGAVTLAAVLATWRDGSAPHEVAEARLLRRILHAGLPPPETQHEVWHGGRFVARLDVAWPDRRVAVELDGFRWHASPRAFQRDRARRNVLVHLGWAVYQATPADLVGDGARVADLLRPHFSGEEVRRPA